MSNNSNNFGKFLLGIGMGAAAGYVIGILTAEKSGRELRKDIQFGSQEFVETLKDKFEDLREHTTIAVKEFKGFADEKLKASAKNIEEQVNSLGKQLEELTKKPNVFSKN
ncbi:MAG: YtxH domain-containing protein [Candidatus Caenarcaniphilales bacterium]|jgi:gas vesicle protein|nr:YtxH domain-containing protein [Candidatus Caenarcaniphilales bacterium]